MRPVWFAPLSENGRTPAAYSGKADDELFAWPSGVDDQSLACTLATGAEAGEVLLRPKR